MELTEAQYARIASSGATRQCQPVEPRFSTPSVAEHGCKWRGLPPRFGNWHTIYTRMNRSRPGCWTGLSSSARADRAPQDRSGVARHHRQGSSRRDGGVKKNGRSIGKSRGGWTTKLHMVAADARTAVAFSLSPGQAHDAPEGRRLLSRLGRRDGNPALVMDRAYEDNATRQLALDGVRARGAAAADPAPALAIPRDVQATQRGRAPVPKAQGLPAHQRFEKLDALFLGPFGTIVRSGHDDEGGAGLELVSVAPGSKR